METAFITGAGSGIGRAVAIALGQRGYALALVGRRRGPLEETAELTSAPELMVLDVDVADGTKAAEAVRAAEEGLGGIGVLVNNAGGARVVPLGEASAADWNATFMQNASTAAYCTMAAWSGMTRLGRAVIVNVASMAVYDPLEGFFAYAAAKGAVAGMTLSAAKEGKRHGIEAYCLCPGAVETPLLRSLVDAAALPGTQTLRSEDVAALAVACVTGDRRGDNGRALPILPRSVEGWWRGWVAANPTGWLGVEPVWGEGAE